MTFFGKSGSNIGPHGSMDLCCSSQSCSPRIDLSNEVLYASNGDCMPRLRPWEVDVPIYPNVAHNLAFHLLGLGIGMFRVFHCLSTINRPANLTVRQSEACSCHISSQR